MKLLSAFCAAACIMTVTSTVSAQSSPEDVAARCVDAVNGIVDRCQNAAKDETTQCVRKIKRLLEDGRERAARRVATDCIRSAATRTENCVNRVQRICRACIDTLLDMGAPHLARRIDNVCEEAISDLRTTLQREKTAIREALAG